MVCLFLCWLDTLVYVVVDGNSNSFFPTTFGFDAEVFGAIFSRFFSVSIVTTTYNITSHTHLTHTIVKHTKTKTKAAGDHKPPIAIKNDERE